MAQAPTFGRRSASVAAQPAAQKPQPPAALELSAEAQAFAAQLRSTPREPDSELAEWRKAHRNRMWSAAGPWKYWACILGALSLIGEVHDFGPASSMVFAVLGGASGLCTTVALWRGLRKPKA